MEGVARKDTQGQPQYLRPVLLVEGARSALDVFDEFVQQHEFKLALHLVCDFILDSDSRQVSESIINQIQHLHTAMVPSHKSA
jgi:hypothetical protein